MLGIGAGVAGKIATGGKTLASYAVNNKAKSIAIAGAGIGFMGDANYNINQGHSVSGSLAKAAVSNVLWATNPMAMGVASVTPLAIQGVNSAFEHRKRVGQDMIASRNAGKTVGGGYMDTSQAQTMRQAALQQIQGNKLNARSALGGEARIFANRYY